MVRVHLIKSLTLVLAAPVFLLYFLEVKTNGREHSCKEEPALSPHHRQDSLVDPANATVEEVYRYLRWSNSSSCTLSHDFGGVLTGQFYDGQKAVCMDAGVRPKPKNCIVYSFGINNEWSFDDAMAAYGCRVYAFDPSMNMTDHNRSASIHFFNTGLWNADILAMDGWKLRQLDSIYETLKSWHGDDVIIDYFKMDIEGAEWLILPQMIKSGFLGRVKQLGIEIHVSANKVEEYQETYRKVRQVEQYGMVRFDSKGNPFSQGPVDQLPGKTARKAYEIAWYNPKFYKHEFV